MTGQIFSLSPFPGSNLPEISIAGKISRQNDLLVLHYTLFGSIDTIVLPPPAAPPRRKDELWKTTCFECFLAVKDQPQYWELNLSPSGDWNAYRMDAYRRVGFREETSMQRLSFEVRKERSKFSLETVLDLVPILRGDETTDAGIAAVIQTKAGHESYWALSHPASHPDFHLREGFILQLAGQTHSSAQSGRGN